MLKKKGLVDRIEDSLPEILDYLTDKDEYGDRKFNAKKVTISSILGVLLTFSAVQGVISFDAAQCLTETAAEIEAKNAEK